MDDYAESRGSENAVGGGKRATRRKIGASGANEGPSAPRGEPPYDGATENGPRRGRGRGALDDSVLVDQEEDDDLFGEGDERDGAPEDAFDDDEHDRDGDDDRGEDGEEEEEEEEEYESWNEWFADYKRVVLGLAAVLLIFVGVLYFGWSFVSGGGDEEAPPAPAPREEERPGSAGGPAAKDAGELKVVVPDGGKEGPVKVDLSESEARAQASSWSGEVTKQRSSKRGEEGYAAVSLSGSGGGADSSASWASCTSVLSEQGARSWLCNLKDTSMDGLILTASQNSDPGPAALEGRMPFLGGRYLVKSEDGSFSASGGYEDVLLDESTMERTYDETYLDDAGEPKHRTLKAEYKVSGDAGLLPAPIGYEPPPGTAPAGGSS